ncbi:MAG: hypothetical protein WKG06_05945 [Segetibacter sp.]
MEKIINIFPVFEGQILTCIGFRVHEVDGTDEQKIEFLKSRIELDVKEMAMTILFNDFTIKLPNGTTIPGITLERYNGLLYNGTDGILYEGIFQAFDFPTNPLQISTPIVDGEIKYNKSLYFDTQPKAPFTPKIHEELPKHYLDDFITDKGFDLVRLIDEDFFGAIRLTYNNGHFVSCLKLLLSAIDSIAFLEFGDIQHKNIFRDWLIIYCDFSRLHINDAELWEYRNSLLHMTNAHSRKVAQEIVKKVKFYVSGEDKPDIISDVQSNYFNIKTLVDVISGGISKWADSFNNDKDKIPAFLERYDLVISDSRYHRVVI